MTEEEFLQLSVDEQNKMVAEAMGKCWHEWNESGTGCKKCETNFEDAQNTYYIHSAEGLKEMLEWLFNGRWAQIDNYESEWEESKDFQINYSISLTTDEDKISNRNINLALALAILKSKGGIK